MPATSGPQYRKFQGCLHNPRHMRGKCPDMPKAKMREFSATPTKGLPTKLSGQAKRIG